MKSHNPIILLTLFNFIIVKGTIFPCNFVNCVVYEGREPSGFPGHEELNLSIKLTGVTIFVANFDDRVGNIVAEEIIGVNARELAEGDCTVDVVSDDEVGGFTVVIDRGLGEEGLYDHRPVGLSGRFGLLHRFTARYTTPNLDAAAEDVREALAADLTVVLNAVPDEFLLGELLHAPLPLLQRIAKVGAVIC